LKNPPRNTSSTEAFQRFDKGVSLYINLVKGMSEDAEKIKRLVSFKKKLEEKVEGLESELKELQAMLETVNSVLLEKGFKHPEIKKESSEKTLQPEQEVSTQPDASAQVGAEYENAVPLTTFNNELLATLYVSENLVRVVPAADKSFNFNTPPFTQFLIEKVFLKMQEKDSELIHDGKLIPDKIFCYDIVRDGDVIREIVVKNLDADRLRELKSSIRWTLEKMYEKMKVQS
jgi:vacuolar-type H+-ATPase subunit I/STV1